MTRRRMLLADQLFLTAHDDVTGKPRQRPRAIALGLAAALLGELMLLEKISTAGDGLVLAITRYAPQDALMHAVLDQLAGEREAHNLRTWIAFLGQSATDWVAARLERTGHVRHTEVRRLLRTEPRWVPTDMSVAATPGALLRHHLNHRQPLEPPEIVLAGLVEAIGLTSLVLWGVPSRTVEYRDWCLSTLPTPLQELIAETTAAVAAAVLSHRS
jgi:Golgi phosphoprotein 3 GPP34